MTLIARFQTIILGAVFILPFPLQATTVVVAITDDGIVMGSDSKTVNKSSDFSSLGELTTEKLIVIQGHIVIACLGVRSVGGGLGHYDFATWIRRLQLELPSDVSVDQFSRVIEQETARVFSTFNTLLESDSVKKQEPDETCRTFIQYLIAGYQAGMPRLYEVRFYIDWNSKNLVGPTRIMLYPDPKDIGDFHVKMYGMKEVIAEVNNQNSYAYKQTMARLPEIFGKLIFHRGHVSIDETISLIQVLIQIEEETNPSDVGGDAQIVKILPDGKAYSVVKGLSESTGAEKKQ
jgi:hypothetical protein